MSTGNENPNWPDKFVPTAPSKKLYGVTGKVEDGVDTPERFEGFCRAGLILSMYNTC